MPKRSLGQNKNDRGKNDPRNGDAKKIEQLNRAVDTLLARADGKPAKVEASVEPLVHLAADLCDLPREEFKAKLKSELRKGRRTMSTVAEPVATVHTVATPRLTFKSAAKAIEFYQQAFGAKETFRFEIAGSIPHAEIMIGDSAVMLTEEWPDGGRFSAETWGHSPVQLSLQVEDVDSFAARAVAAGLKIALPIQDQFYGRREGTFVDPFGYTWSISTVKEEMSVEEMHRRMPSAKEPTRHGTEPAVNPIPRGFRTLTTYLVAQDVDALAKFVTETFGAVETLRAGPGSEGGLHCEVRIGDSMLMMGGGAAGFSWRGAPKLGAFHVYVPDCDATYKLALQAGATSISEPTDQEYGERSGSVKDAAGNHWYIATRKGKSYKWEGAPDVQPYLHPLRAEPVVNFLRRAFGAEELGRHTAPDGVIHHTMLKIGTSYMEMGEAQGPYQPMASMFYLYVPDVDAVYRRALAAGATSIHEPADQPYGDRVGAVKDAFGNQWYIGAHVKDVTV